MDREPVGNRLLDNHYIRWQHLTDFMRHPAGIHRLLSSERLRFVTPGFPLRIISFADFFSPLLAMMDRMVAERFLHEDQRRDLWHGEDFDALFAWMRDYTPARADKWLDEKRRKDLR